MKYLIKQPDPVNREPNARLSLDLNSLERIPIAKAIG